MFTRRTLVFMGLFLPIFALIVINQKGTLNTFSISVLKLSENVIEKGRIQTYPLTGTTGLANDVIFRTERAATPIALAIFSLVTGISPFAAKMLPMGLLVILIAVLLARSLCLRGYWAIAYATLLGFSTVMISLIDFSQFIVGFLLFFIMLWVWVRKLRLDRSTVVLLLVLFFVNLKNYYTTSLLFLAFISSAKLLQDHKFSQKAHQTFLVALSVLFASDSIVISYMSLDLINNFLLTLTRSLEFMWNRIIGERELAVQMYPRAGNYILVLATAAMAFAIFVSILIWITWREAREFPWSYVGFGIIFTAAIEYVLYLTSGTFNVITLPRMYLLLGPLIALHVARQLLKKKGGARVIAFMIVLLLFSGHIAAWSVYVLDEKTYHSIPDLAAYPMFSPACKFSVTFSNQGSKILASHDMAFLALAYGNISRASDISTFGKKVWLLAKPDQLYPDEKKILLFSNLFGSIKTIKGNRNTEIMMPSEGYLQKLNNSTIFNRVFDDEVGLVYISEVQVLFG